MKNEREQAAFEWIIMLGVVLVIAVGVIHYIGAKTAPVWAGVASQIQ